MHKKQLMTHKPAYRHGQLLLENDFIDEQQYHSHARYLHAHNLHGFGVVHGLEVSRASDLAVTVSPGFAIDRKGREIELQNAETLELQGLAAGTLAWVTIGYRSERPAKEGEAANRIDCYAYLRIATGVEPFDARLASVRVDARGRLAHDAIDVVERDQLRTVIAPGSVTASALDDHLRKGWLRMPFRPTSIPQDQDNAQPPFRVGPTETEAHEKLGEQPNTRGAGGTMAIPLPPQAARIHRLRVAGGANEKKITVKLFKAGWNAQERKHAKVPLLAHDIGQGAYDETWVIPDKHAELDLECSTLSLELRCEGYAKVSLIAVEVSY